MQHSAEPDFLSQLDTIFTQLNPQEVEQFYATYKQWLLQQHIASLQQRIVHIQQQLVENTQLIQQTQPSPIALATLARLQSHGVNDIDLLDSMLARGEAWLDATMQRLDYCEQIDDFIRDDYTQWCKLALEGAFDWIDSMLDEASPTSPPTPIEETPTSAADTVATNDTEATEALLLQKLTSDSDEQEGVSWQEETLKQTAIKLPAQEEAEEPASSAAITPSQNEEATLVEFAPPETAPYSDETTATENEQPPLIEFAPEEGSANIREAHASDGELLTLVEFAPTEQTSDPEPEYPENIEVDEPGQIEEPGSEEQARQPLVQPEISPNKQPLSFTSLPPKRGFLRRLVGILLGA